MSHLIRRHQHSLLALIAIAFFVGPTPSGADPASDLAAAQAREGELLTLRADAERDLQKASELLDRLDERLARTDARVAQKQAEIERREDTVIEARVNAADYVEAEQMKFESTSDRVDKEKAALFGLAGGLLLIGLALLVRGPLGRSRLAQGLLKQQGTSLVMPLFLVVLLSVVLILVGNSPIAVGGGVFLLVGSLGFATIVESFRRTERSKEDGVVRKRRFAVIPLAALVILLFMGGILSTGAGAFLPEPDPPVFSEKTERLAEEAKGDALEPVPEQIKEARDELAPIIVAREALRDSRRLAYRSIRTTGRVIRQSRRGLRRTGRQIRIAERRLARQERAAAAAAAAASAASSSGGSSYSIPSSCDGAPSNIPVPPGSSLDGDGDGIGCES
jgi:hypothetical protein